MLKSKAKKITQSIVNKEIARRFKPDSVDESGKLNPGLRSYNDASDFNEGVKLAKMFINKGNGLPDIDIIKQGYEWVKQIVTA
jgi:hypothetical protein